jgi:hypothetical protein
MKTDRTNRQELERRLEAARRIVALPLDEVTVDRLRHLIKELEEELKGDLGSRIVGKNL